MANLARFSLILVITLVTLSAYLRLDHSGIGCEPWPTCYGNIGVITDSPAAADAYERLIQDAREPLSWATPLHRLVASVLGLLVLAMALLSLRHRANRLMTFSLLGLTVFLAWLGIYSEGLHSPAVVMGNLAGGFLMLGLLGWMVVSAKQSEKTGNVRFRRITIAALIALSVQIAVGGLTSANFAAASCQTLPDCHGTWLPGKQVFDAMNLTRIHDIGATGMVLGGPEQAEIHKLHRLLAALATIIILAAGIAAIRYGGALATIGIAVIALLATEVSLGFAAVASQLPIGIAVAHNWVAAILLLALLKLLAERQASPG